MWARMGARSTFRGPLGRLRRLAGGFWGVFGVFGVLFGSLEASRGGLEASLGRLWADFVFLVGQDCGQGARTGSPGLRPGDPELCFSAELGRGLCHPFHTPCARQAGGGGFQSLRAFRWAEVIVDAVLFKSCVGGVTVAMMFASFFHFEFGFLWGIVLVASVESLSR